MMMKVLIAVDGSSRSLRAVEFAVQLTAGQPGLELTLLYVRPVHVGPIVGLGAVGPDLEERLEHELGLAEHELLDEARALATGLGVVAKEQVETGNVAQTICRVADEGGFTLIVLGSSGRGELTSVLLGSTANAVIHASTVPVLVVK